MNGHRLWQCNLMLHALGLAVTAGLVVLAVGLVGIPMTNHQAQLQAQIVNMERLLAERASIERESRQLKVDVEGRAEQWNELLSRIPPEAQVSEFLALLTHLAGKTGLKVEFFNPGATRTKERFDEMDIDLQATGDYVGICAFLDGLSSMPRICNISKLDVNAVTQVPGQYSVQIGLRILYKFDDSPADASVPLASSPST